MMMESDWRVAADPILELAEKSGFVKRAAKTGRL
jgi:hypothetical protein